MSNPTFVINDGARKIEGTLTYGDGSPIVPSAVTLRWRLQQGGTVRSGTATIVDAATGKVSYTFATGDFPDGPGTYVAEWRATVGGQPLTVPSPAPMLLHVRAQI